MNKEATPTDKNLIGCVTNSKFISHKCGVCSFVAFACRLSSPFYRAMSVEVRNDINELSKLNYLFSHQILKVLNCKSWAKCL